MMDLCKCDYDMLPEFLTQATRKARKQHRCCECGAMIECGERYERHDGKWDGEMCTFKWCARCAEVAAFIRAHVPCFCWNYHSLHEDAFACAEHMSKEAPGLLFGVARRVARARRHAKTTTATPAEGGKDENPVSSN